MTRDASLDGKAVRPRKLNKSKPPVSRGWESFSTPSESDLKPAAPPVTNPWRKPPPLKMVSKELRVKTLTWFSRLEASLWEKPLCSDVVVVCGVNRFFVHRSIVIRESGWFREHLRPPEADGSSVSVKLRCAPEAAGYCVRFMYTRRVEICEGMDILEPGYLTRCVLMYCSAVLLRVDSMVSHILGCVETAFASFAEKLNAHPGHEQHADMNVLVYIDLPGCLELTYFAPNQATMKPMRLLIARFIDSILLWLSGHPWFASDLGRGKWARWVPRLLEDQAEYRGVLDARPSRKSLVPDEAAVEELLNNERLRQEGNTIMEDA